MISTRYRPLILGATLVPGVLAASLGAAARQATPVSPSPPTQPATGPGGADYAYAEVVAQDYGQDPPSGVNPHDYWLFEPGDAPSDVPLPLVFFLVGGMERRPEGHRIWIDHLVRRGAVVMFPARWLAGEIDQTKADISAALAELERGDHAPVDLNRTVIVGQGIGGPVAAHLAAAPPQGLPAAAALMVVTPETAPADRRSSLSDDLATLPAETRVVLVGAEHADNTADLDDAWAALVEADRVPANQRAYVVLRSDWYGTPNLQASQHVAHTAGPDQPDALDWYGTWKLLDGLMGCAFAGEWCDYAFGDTPEVRHMGSWSDGVPVTEALIVADPTALDATPAG